MSLPNWRRRRQDGAALLLILALLVTGGLAALFAFASPRTITSEDDARTRAALVEARSALIVRAAMDANRPGSLPCPDTDDDGIAELLVGPNCPSYVGRLPWQTLGLPDLRDAGGERLWYALSPSLRDDNSAQPINSVETPIQLSVIGAVPMSNVAAIVFAPGPKLGSQSRNTSAEQNDPVNYLEGENANGDTIYQSQTTSSIFNDQLLVITHDHLFGAVEWRVARELRNVLDRYFQAFHYYPYANDYLDASQKCTASVTRGRIPNPDASPISATCATNADWPPIVPPPQFAPPAWFTANNWHLLTYYAVAPACAYAGVAGTLDCNNSGGFLSVNGVSGIRAVVIVGSNALGSQPRPCISASDCIEQPLATSNQYQRQPVSSSFNDKVVIVAP
jgi:hypothetical protein